MQDLEQVVVALLVGGCALYVVKAMAPRALKNWFWSRLPAAWQSPWMRSNLQSGTCNCQGCDAAEPRNANQPAATQPLHFVKRIR